MKVDIPKGKYIVAVSGGVDSMVLLDILSKKPEIELIVAHFNHGIRPDSSKDEKLIRQTAKKPGLVVEVGYGHLGKNTSEEQARRARYAFLEKTRRKHQAEAIITAHHADDQLETALINLLRGTNWRGLQSIKNDKKIQRPLLKISKKEILAYAKAKDIKWREDSTNSDDNYLRNYLRLKVIPGMTAQSKKMLRSKIESIANNKQKTEHQIATISRLLMKNNHIDRLTYSKLPKEITKEVVAGWFRDAEIGYNQKNIRKTDLLIRNSKGHTSHSLDKNHQLVVSQEEAYLVGNSQAA